MKITQFIVSILLLSFFSCNETTSKKDNVNSETTEVQELDKLEYDTLGIALNTLESLHTKRNVNSYDKTLIEYIDSNPNRPDSIRKTIYLLPFGNIKPNIQEVIENETQYLETFFQLKVKILPSISFEEIKENGNIKTRLVSSNDFGYYSKMKGGAENLREQIEATSFINSYMTDSLPQDAIAVLGITEHDIYNPKYNYLFGTSLSSKKVGLVSTFRLVDYGDYTKFNIRKVISKQIVNLFSIRNVKDYECLVNFHNNKEELENGEFKLSPKVLEKLKYSIGFKYEKRFEELLNFWTKEDNQKMITYYTECLKKIKNR